MTPSRLLVYFLYNIGLPKSCKEIKESGIGSMDGQYVVEACDDCHLTLICQDMEGDEPKEFLDGPTEDGWKYWHFAVLIKVTPKDTETISDGACLENSGQFHIKLGFLDRIKKICAFTICQQASI